MGRLAGTGRLLPNPHLLIQPYITLDDMQRAFDDFERFLHEETSIPPLVKIALVHYQFETIHPFLDGNGRLGRLLIAFLLVEQQLLPQPLLYLSAFFEHHGSEYYDRLQAVRERVNFASGSCSSSPVSRNWPTTPSIVPSDWSIFESATVNG